MYSLRDSVDVLRKSIYQFGLGHLKVGQLHNVISKSVIENITKDWRESQKAHNKQKRAYYLSAEFLMGRAIYNNLFCSGLLDEATDILKEDGIDINCFEEIEDAALGNGGLGRLAACYLDSAATCNLPLDGYGIRYGYGLFKQTFDKGFQNEDIDNWRRIGDPWSVRQSADTVTVNLCGYDVYAVPYDMPIIGWGTNHISTLRLWQCEPVHEFDFNLFDQGRYDEAVAEKTAAENISRVLYPNDSSDEGRILRLAQQYFFCSASLQDMIRHFKKDHGDNLEKLPEYITIQLNDTHPTISIPELIRLLMEDGFVFRDAYDIACQCFNYTNHTIMAEALEKWDIKFIHYISPRIEEIVKQIDEHTLDEFKDKGVEPDRLKNLQILQGGTVHMAHLACACSQHINGVAEIHSGLLKTTVLKDYYSLYPNKFTNVTNGITQRRWLGVCNPKLSAFITKLLGSDEWLRELSMLERLKKYADDDKVLDEFIEIKKHNKEALNKYIQLRDNKSFDTNTIVDVQVKRIHEYKRQFLNILTILELYFQIKEGTLKDFTPTTYIFGGKSAPGYLKAKAIIKVINTVADLIDNDPVVSKYIKVVFVSNYDVSYAEKLVAAADISEQISTAGTEASGTGNMKLMLNGAVTLGTYDGANIEIVEEASEDNNYIFGARVEDLNKIKKSYNPRHHYRETPGVRRVLDALINGTLDDCGSGFFEMLYGGMMHEDKYFVFEDFRSCLEAKLQANKDAKDKRAFAKKEFLNMASAGKFSSDRSVREYAKNIWGIDEIQL
ncbi:MAG: glycogen/starch/alpha-glucan phosphorylase [Coriobacteriia bacterium]|nr:glycogen/starch/alpha-glucan phosphorylase [Coriobacteriia bacterium]